jgi:hypothetical protein
MKHYFIHCYWHQDSRAMHVVYLGDCSRSEAEAKFEAALQETDGFDLMTLEEGGGAELRRYTRPLAAEPVGQPSLLNMRSLRERYLMRQCA